MSEPSTSDRGTLPASAGYSSEDRPQESATGDSTADRLPDQLVALFTQPTVVLTLEGRILVSNRSFAELLDRPSTALAGHTLRELAAPKSRSALETLLRRGRVARAEGSVVFLTGNGETAAVQIAVSPFSAGVGTPVLVVTDQTERRTDEAPQPVRAVLGENEERYRRIVSFLPVAVYTCNASGLITYYNDHAVRLWGRAPRPGDTDHRFCGSYRLWRPDGRPLPHDQTPMAIAIRENRRFTNEEVVIERPDGSRIQVLVNIDPLSDTAGRPAGAINVFHDVTAHRQTEEALLRHQQQLQVISDVVPALISYVDTDYRYRFCNRSYTHWFGLGSEEITGRAMREVLGEEAWQKLGPHAVRAMGGEAVDFEVEVPYRYGGPRWIHAVYTPDRDPQGAVRGLVIMVSDITARKLQERQLSEQARLLDLSNDAMIVRDMQNRIIFWNKGAQELYGYTAVEALDRLKYELLRTEFPEPIEHILDRLYRDGRWTGELVHRTKTGDRLIVSARWALDREPGGEPRAILETTNDITARKQAEEALREADRRKDEFLATLAHELRNPLAPMRNAVRILMSKGPPDPDQVWARGVLDRQLQLMARLLEDLLDVSRITRNMLELRKVEVELRTVIEAALETSRPLLDANRQELALELPPEPIELNADPVRLAQVFANLLNNAAKYSETGSVIHLGVERVGKDVVVTVRDPGIGIAPEMLPRIFEIFSQAKPALQRAQGGLGIGLSLVKGLVEMHGGSVEARSEGVGKGSEFRVRLPALERTHRKPRSESPERDDLPSPTKSRILVVDDNRDSVDSLALLLRIMGHEVRTAHDGEEAVAVATSYRPAAILLDLGMPKLNGYEACRRIREQPWGRNILVLALTGWGQEEDRRRTQEAGFDHHLVKPVDPAVLMRLLSGRMPEEFAAQ